MQECALNNHENKQQQCMFTEMKVTPVVLLACELLTPPWPLQLAQKTSCCLRSGAEPRGRWIAALGV